MSFVARELDRIQAALAEKSEGEKGYAELYAAQTALAWALEPTGYMSPYDMITGAEDMEEVSKDCSVEHRPSQS